MQFCEYQCIILSDSINFKKSSWERNKSVGQHSSQSPVTKINGTVILDGDYMAASKNGTIDHNQHPGLLNKTGHIGFLGHGDILRFKNMRIKRL